MTSIILLILTATPALGVFGATSQLWLPAVVLMLGLLPGLALGTIFASSANKNQNVLDNLEAVKKSLVPATTNETTRRSPATATVPTATATGVAPGTTATAAATPAPRRP